MTFPYNIVDLEATTKYWRHLQPALNVVLPKCIILDPEQESSRGLKCQLTIIEQTFSYLPSFGDDSMTDRQTHPHTFRL